MSSDLNILSLAATNDVDGLKRVIETRSDVNFNQSPELVIAMHYASSNNSIDTIKLLYEHGARINGRDGNGYTPLHWALVKPNDETIRLLLNLGADISAEITTPYPGHKYSIHEPTVLNFIPLQWFKKEIYEAKDGKYNSLGKIQIVKAFDFFELHHLIDKAEKDKLLNELGPLEFEMTELGQIKILLGNTEYHE